MLPIDIDKNMIQMQKKRLNNTCKLSIFAGQKLNTNTYLMHFIEKSKVCIVAMECQTCPESCELNTTLAL